MQSEISQMSHPSAISSSELTTSFAAAPWAERFPPVLTIAQTCELLQVPKRTLFRWLAEGKLGGASARIGKHRRFLRDHLIQSFFDTKNK